MAQQIIELGQMPDGAGGDTNRSANVKCNENFTELYDELENTARSGANRDITSLSGLTTALSVAQGGTGAKDAAEARGNLGAAQNGKNQDITELTSLSTPLSVGQGGTGAKTGADACRNLGATALGQVNMSTGTILRNSNLPHIASITADLSTQGALMFSNGGNVAASAVITFHRDGYFGCHFGIDTDNQLKVGGWSMGNVAHRIFHGGNTTRAADGTLKVV